MILRALALENWLSYRGVTRLEGLGPRAYAMVAHLADDPERSNGLGKSALAESILFALKGWTNPDRGFKADEWITDGEKGGSVYLEFDDGYWVKRSRSGRSWNLETQTGAKKDEAQREIDEHILLSTDDALATTFFRQRDMARFVLAKPEPRMDVVSDWLRLGPLEKCAERASERARVAEAEAADVLQEIRVAEEIERRELGEGTLDQLEQARAAAREKLDVAEASLEAARVAWQVAGRAQSSREKLAEFERLNAEGWELKKQIDVKRVERLLSDHREKEKRSREIARLLSDAERDHAQKQKLALGQFDGHCPVANIACPAREQINAPRADNDKLRIAARNKLTAVQVEWERADAEERAARAELDEVRRIQARFDALRERALAIKPEADAAKASRERLADVDALRAAMTEAEDQRAQLAREHDALERAVALVKKSRAQRARLAEVARQHEAKIRVARQGAMIFGRNGAQRRIGERTLAQIQRAANASIATCGLDLEVELRWSREAGGLAKACEACGRPFPASQKVKACESCGAQRGPHLVHKLDLLLSAQGGAYEDLAGYAIQLAAGKWLRDDRGSPLAIAVLDEPNASFDVAIRRMFTTRLPSMLFASGVRQAFVISHSADVLASLPGRIEIVSDGRFAQARVVAA